MQRRVTPRTKAVILCTPHNPASTIVVGPRLERFIGALGDDPPLVILDEAYRDFCDDPETADGVDFVRRHPTVIVLRTFSKIAGLAGLRVGYAVARPEVIARLNRVRAPYNVNPLAQDAAEAALEDREHLERTRAVIIAERPRLRSALEARGAPSPPSQANFLLVKVGDRASGIRHGLLEAGILVRDGAGVGFPGHLRIAIGTPALNNRLLAAWDQATKQMSQGYPHTHPGEGRATDAGQESSAARREPGPERGAPREAAARAASRAAEPAPPGSGAPRPPRTPA
jgi:histidinol-phosphate aminotransferase